jgi:uncharacterized delta-60 repeat protein
MQYVSAISSSFLTRMSSAERRGRLFSSGVAPRSTFRAARAAAEALECRRLLSADAPAAALPGDINGDNAVNGSDFAILAGNFGKSGMSAAQGDLNGDGAVNGSDFAILAGNFGKTVAPVLFAGDPDPTFGGGDGAANVAFDGVGDLTGPPSVDTRGGFTVAVTNTGNAGAALARFNSAGELDAGFSGDGRLVVPGFTAFDVQIQEDGKILVAGRTAGGASGTAAAAVMRLNTDGSADTTFGGGDGLATFSTFGTVTSVRVGLRRRALQPRRLARHHLLRRRRGPAHGSHWRGERRRRAG